MTEPEPNKVVEFELSKQLKTKLRGVFYDTDSNSLSVYIKPESESPSSDPKSIRCNVDKSSMRNTLEQFKEIADGTLDQKTKLLCVYSINYHLRKHVKFDGAEQKWYSKNYPDDPGLVDKSKGKGHKKESSDNEDDDEKTKPKKIAINKYSGNGRRPLHESVIIGETPVFVTLHDKLVPEYIPKLDTTFGITYYPNGTINTVTPLPYIFDSEDEFMKYVKLAHAENYDSLYLKVETAIKRYVNVEEYYYPILVGDIIWSYFQDKFGYTHYLIFTGDNGSGKNSALLVFKYLGYRVFYVVSASAPNYWTAYGSQEEGQVSIAEDEADDIGEDKRKNDLLKAGYQSGGSVPKIDLEGGRTQDNWLVYGLKWLAMEELKIDKKTKGVLHRSIPMGFLAGDVDYNIKDVIRSADDPEYKPLIEELYHIRKLLFCFRLIRHKDIIPMVDLNVKGRTAELTSPLIRLFQDAPLAREKMFDSLSEFMKERNQNMLNSFEAKLRESVQTLIDLRLGRINQVGKLDPPTEEDTQLGPYTFTNESIKDKLVSHSEAEEDTEKGKKGLYYSAEIGAFGQAKITTVLKSKFKAKVGIIKKINNKTHRCVEFKQAYLNRLKTSYEVEDKIRIVSKEKKEKVTPVTLVTPLDELSHNNLNDFERENERKNEEKEGEYSSRGVTTVTTVTEEETKQKPRQKATCPKCGYTDDAFYMKNHHCEGTD
jgi:hypothetical protein